MDDTGSMEGARGMVWRPAFWVVVIVALAGVTLLYAVRDEASSGCSSDLLIAASIEGTDSGAWTPEVAVLGSSDDLEPVTRGWVATQPSLSPAGDRLAVVRAHGDYESAGPNRTELWTVGTDGGSARRLTTGPLDDDPDWARTGERIAFVRSDGPRSMLMTVPAAGGDATAVYEPRTGIWLAAPAWSPDGTLLAFVVAEPVADQDHISLAVVDGDGGEPRLLTDVPRPVSVDWHPNGGSLLVTGDGTGHVVEVESGDKALLGRDIQAARWMPDGGGVIYTQIDGTLAQGSIEDGTLRATHELAVVSAGYVYSDIDVGACS